MHWFFSYKSVHCFAKATPSHATILSAPQKNEKIACSPKSSVMNSVNHKLALLSSSSACGGSSIIPFHGWLIFFIPIHPVFQSLTCNQLCRSISHSLWWWSRPIRRPIPHSTLLANGVNYWKLCYDPSLHNPLLSLYMRGLHIFYWIFKMGPSPCFEILNR